MSEIGVIHEDCAGFGDGLGFQVLSEEDHTKTLIDDGSRQALNENMEKEPTKSDK